MRGDTSLLWLKVSLFKTIGSLPLAEDLQLLASFGRVPGTALSVPVLVAILKPPPFFYQHFIEHIQRSAAMHYCTFCITALFLDSYITLRIKGGNVGHLILNGLVWKTNGQKESKRPWDVKPNGHNNVL